MMNRTLSFQIRGMLPNGVAAYISQVRQMVQVAYYVGGRHRRECPLCGYAGYFRATGVPLRFDAICKRCGSAERHRQHHLLVERNSKWIDGARILHFGAERCFANIYPSRAAQYVKADIEPNRDEVYQDIQSISYGPNSFDTIICHQVLEHVQDDAAAMDEIYRVLKPNGRAIITVPIVHKWSDSYVDESVSTDAERDLYFGQGDHRRYYGQNFVSRLQAAGFEVYEDVAREPDVSRYSLIRGDTIFIAHKADPALRARSMPDPQIASLDGVLRKAGSMDLRLEPA